MGQKKSNYIAYNLALQFTYKTSSEQEMLALCSTLRNPYCLG